MSSRSTDEDEILTPEQVGSLLQRPARSVRDMASRGELPGVLLGGRWRFSKRAVLALFEPKNAIVVQAAPRELPKAVELEVPAQRPRSGLGSRSSPSRAAFLALLK